VRAQILRAAELHVREELLAAHQDLEDLASQVEEGRLTAREAARQLLQRAGVGR
jgi:hypothetical protein